jgi:hypothetical protein
MDLCQATSDEKISVRKIRPPQTGHSSDPKMRSRGQINCSMKVSRDRRKAMLLPAAQSLFDSAAVSCLYRRGNPAWLNAADSSKCRSLRYGIVVAAEPMQRGDIVES